jgi:hypothetical protein
MGLLSGILSSWVAFCDAPMAFPSLSPILEDAPSLPSVPLLVVILLTPSPSH